MSCYPCPCVPGLQRERSNEWVSHGLLGCARSGPRGDFDDSSTDKAKCVTFSMKPCRNCALVTCGSFPLQMPLPRPARILRQPSIPIFRMPKPPIRLASSQIVPSQPASPELDPSFTPFLKSVDLRARRRPSTRPELEVVGRPVRPRKGYGATRSEEELEDLDEGEEGDRLGLGGLRREERRSPAAVLGSKRLGIAVLPEELVEGVQGVIDGQSSSSPSVFSLCLGCSP